jgi:hypothetical protein
MVKKYWPPPKALFEGFEKLKVRQIGNELKITQSWSTRLGLVLAPLFGFFVMITWFLSVFTSERDISNLFYNYWFIYGGIGLIAAYIGLAAFLNKTVVIISPEKIKITTSPLPGFIWRTR